VEFERLEMSHSSLSFFAALPYPVRFSRLRRRRYFEELKVAAVLKTGVCWYGDE
jgi:hypothetical protein